MTEAEKTLLLERYEALLQAARSVYALHTLDDLVEQVLKHSLRIMQVEACSLYLPDRKTEELIIYSARGRDDSAIHSARIPWQVGIAGSVFQKQQYERIDDVQGDARFNREFDLKNGFQTRAMLCFPLLESKTCLGVLQCINPLHHPLFHEVDEKVFEGLARILISALLRLERENQAAAEAKLQQELSLAQEIQKSFLPPEIYIHGAAEFHAQYQPARSIGGDFYAAFPISRGRYLVATGDVSGKGIPAALTTAQVTGQLSVIATVSDGSLSEFVRLLNQSLYGRLAAGRFVATTFLLYDPAQAHMEVCCAGQFTPWRWCEERNHWNAVEVARGLPLGVFPGFAYRAEIFPCQPGEKWLMFSDGITEGRNAQGDEYGTDRLAASLQPGSPRRTLERAWKDWSQFAATQDLHDDACLTVFGCRPALSLSFTSSPAQCKLVRNFIESWTSYVGYDDLTRGQIQLAVDEAVTNIMRHTYQRKEGEKIDLNIEFDERFLVFRLRDYGPTIDPEKLTKRCLTEVRPGGLGLHLLEMTFSTVRFEPRDPGNELVLSKAII